MNQDGNPVVGAQVSFKNNLVLYSATTDDEGRWQLTIAERISQIVYFNVKASGYAEYNLYGTPILDGSTSALNVILYNAITYKAGERSTIFLPVAPDASWGKYYRFDRIEGNRLIFERELSPQPRTPYIFFANEDLRIDISEMDMRTIESEEWQSVDDKVYFIGSENVIEDPNYPGTLRTYSPDESISLRQDPLPFYIYPMHAILEWYTTKFPYSANEVSFVYQESSAVVTGTVRDQDGNPIAGAQVTLANGTYYQTSTTDADGHYQVEVEDKEKEYVVSARAYGHTSITRGPVITPIENNVCDLVLYNALNYQAGKRYTIVLPIAPDASAGRYFRLDRVEGGNIIFKREYSPQADVPYVFYPNKDFRIDLREMDLSKEATTTKIIVTHDGVGSRDAAYFMGSYSYLRSSILEVDTPEYFDDDDQGDNNAGLYHIDAMHATLLWNWHAFDKPFQPSYAPPSFVFHDPEDDISPYRPFIEEGKVWKVGRTYGTAHSAYQLTYCYFEGDTIIDGRECKKMRWRHEKKDSEPWTEYVGALYEDTRCVYLILPGTTELKLIYDFASSEGQSLDLYNHANAHLIETVEATMKKRFTQANDRFKGECYTVSIKQPSEIDEFGNWIYSDNISIEETWMEGVGSQHLPLDNCSLVPGYYECLMLCTVGDEVLYYNPTIIDDVTPDDGGEVKKNTIDFTHIVKTQPKAPRREESTESADEENLTGEYSLKELFVNFKPLAGPYVITICNESGTEVYRKEVQTNSVIALNTDISDYPKGEYTITVENDAEAYTANFSIDDAVGIKPTPSEIVHRTSDNPAFFDLSGRRIVSRTLPRGVYIKDGRKVVR